jgi:hypothetical protein
MPALLRRDRNLKVCKPVATHADAPGQSPWPALPVAYLCHATHPEVFKVRRGEISRF